MLEKGVIQKSHEKVNDEKTKNNKKKQKIETFSKYRVYVKVTGRTSLVNSAPFFLLTHLKV